MVIAVDDSRRLVSKNPLWGTYHLDRLVVTVSLERGDPVARYGSAARFRLQFSKGKCQQLRLHRRRCGEHVVRKGEGENSMLRVIGWRDTGSENRGSGSEIQERVDLAMLTSESGTLQPWRLNEQ